MDTTLLLYLDNEWKEVDLYEDIPISVVIQETDLTDFQGRKSPYSKQFSVPGTMNNGTIFEHYYEVNGIEFDPLVKIQAVVQYRGTDIFYGVCRLQSVIVTNDYVEYEVYIMGDVADFVNEIKDLTLRDLNWVDLQHELTYDNIVLSWEAKNNDTDGLLGGSVVYPLIHWGLDYGTGTTPTFSFDFTGSSTSFTTSSHPIPPSYFKPAVRLYDVIQRLFSATTYSVQSDFMETDYFKSIYMDTFLNGKLGIDVASGVSNQNLFVSYTQNKQFEYDGNNILRPLQFSVNLPGGSDPLGNFINANGVFKVPYAGDYGFNVRMNYRSEDLLQINGDIAVVVFTGTSPTNLTTEVYEGTHYQIGIRGLFPPQRQQGSINEFINLINVPAGTCVSVFIKEYDDYGSFGISRPRGVYNLTPFNSGGVIDPFIRWDLYSSPTLSGTQLVDLKLGIPDLEANTFLKSVTTMFNLVIIQDEPNKTIRIEPYNSYYNEDLRVERDWTEKLDLSSSYKIEPLSFDLSKELQFTYGEGSEEYLNKLWEDSYNYNYGRLKYVSTSNILTDTQIYELPFVPLPTQSLPGAPNFVIPMVYRELNTENSISQSPYSSKPHIFFWVGNRYSYTDSTKQDPGVWYMLSGGTSGGTISVSQTTYPCVSHLSSLDIYNNNFVSDLNFGFSTDFFFFNNPYPVQATPFTLYNSFWRDYIDNTYSKETKRFIGKFYLEPIEIYQTKLTDKIFVKDSFYRIEKINDGNLVEPQFTEVSLIKERGGYYQIIPPAPYYFYEPNQSYPSTFSPTLVPSYTGMTTSEVCSGTSGTGNIYTTGVVPYHDGSIVYYYDGYVYVPLPYGTNIRWTGETTTYVVINNNGQVIQIDC